MHMIQPSNDPREQETMPDRDLLHEMAASLYVPVIARELTRAHWALEGHGEPPCDQWQRTPMYQKVAMMGVRYCSEPTRRDAELAAVRYAAYVFPELEWQLSRVDCDQASRWQLIANFANRVTDVYTHYLKHGAAVSAVEETAYTERT